MRLRTPTPREFLQIRRAAGLVVLGLFVLAASDPAAAQGRALEVKFELPVRARLDLSDRSSITVAPFLVVGREDERLARRANIDVQQEFERYLLHVLRRETDLRLIDSGALDYPSYDLDALAAEESFWRDVGRRTQADLILSGSLDFDIQDRSGYRTEEYVSPYDGRTYYRQVLVEQTGFEYDIVLKVFDGRTGEQLYTDNFKDFKRFEGTRTDPMAGMFENLRAIEDRIVGVFSQRTIETRRQLFR